MRLLTSGDQNGTLERYSTFWFATLRSSTSALQLLVSFSALFQLETCLLKPYQGFFDLTLRECRVATLIERCKETLCRIRCIYKPLNRPRIRYIRWRCQHCWRYFSSLFLDLTMTCAAVMLILRTWLIWGRCRRIAVGLGITFLLSFSAMIVITTVWFARAVSEWSLVQQRCTFLIRSSTADNPETRGRSKGPQPGGCLILQNSFAEYSVDIILVGLETCKLQTSCKLFPEKLMTHFSGHCSHYYKRIAGSQV